MSIDNVLPLAATLPQPSGAFWKLSHAWVLATVRYVCSINHLFDCFLPVRIGKLEFYNRVSWGGYLRGIFKRWEHVNVPITEYVFRKMHFLIKDTSLESTHFNVDLLESFLNTSYVKATFTSRVNKQISTRHSSLSKLTTFKRPQIKQRIYNSNIWKSRCSGAKYELWHCQNHEFHGDNNKSEKAGARSNYTHLARPN